MNRYVCFLLYFLTGYSFCISQIPKLGNDTLLDIATWNIEWLGNTGFGPTDESLQYNNVKTVLTQTDWDVIAFQEVSDHNTYLNLSDELAFKYGTFISTYTPVQKTGIYFKKSMFEMIAPLTQNILLPYSSNPFAGRPPLQVALKTLGGNKTDTLYFIVVHLKAHTGNLQASYNMRKDAALNIKDYMEQDLAGKKVIVIGDWNDDVDASIYNNSETPFKSFVDAGYMFPTRKLSDEGKDSWAFGENMVDHIMTSKSLDSLYIPASAQIFDNASSYIPNFSNNTSDHFPVYAFFNWKKLTVNPPVGPGVGEEEITGQDISIYPNPAYGIINIPVNLEKLTIYSIAGKAVITLDNPGNEINISGLENGMYYLTASYPGYLITAKFAVTGH
ncbi:MAG TPA: endonuclease/exonuclease/phosphatase family protein [Bacteroidia bacterium]|nr:endonuclease/exonuclease/phosphatase family protein [Bacteroidia bacterium]